MIDKRVESSLSTRRADIYNKVAAVLGSLPERFTATELYQLAGIKAKHPASRMLVASVLTDSFGFTNVCCGGKRSWKR